MAKTFKELGLSKELISVLSDLNIKTPSEIQVKSIPSVLAKKDLIGGSATGSGKTLVFASAIIENLEKNSEIQALVLTPTRELAEQVSNSITKFSKHKKLKSLAIYGGVSIDNQIRQLQDTDIVVGTPGRILDHLNRGTLNLGKVKFLVLDEVDRMFDMGFQHDVERILQKCSTKRQTMLFSATISIEMDHLAQKYTEKPVEISIESHVDPSKLKQIYYDVPDKLKFSLFVHLIKKEKSRLVMVFCSTRRNVDFVTKNLNNLGIKSKAIHGGMVQNKRNNVLNEFNSNKGVNVLVCTDVAARGLDIKEVSHVYNYDLPKTSDEYIHRIGRTARAGEEGIAINILCSRDYENFGKILDNKKIKIEKKELPRFERVGIIVDNDKSRGFRNNKRFSRDNRGSGGRPFRDRKYSRNNNSRNRNSENRFSRNKNNFRERSRNSENKYSRNNRDSRDNKGSREKPFRDRRYSRDNKKPGYSGYRKNSRDSRDSRKRIETNTKPRGIQNNFSQGNQKRNNPRQQRDYSKKRTINKKENKKKRRQDYNRNSKKR
ncbi:MAG: DEAD/DEAH box helicase [Nanoarchaeota archaeon]